VALFGELGAGEDLSGPRSGPGSGSVDDVLVASPVFHLLHEYEGRLPLYHLDCLPAGRPGGGGGTGFGGLFSKGAESCAVEWAERVALFTGRTAGGRYRLGEAKIGARIRLAARGANSPKDCKKKSLK